MEHEIRKNLVFLAENITNLTKVLTYLVQNDIISENDSEEVEAKTTSFEKNRRLLQIIQKKDWKSIRNEFLDILRKTSNKTCADQIEGLYSLLSNARIKHSKIGKCWWPEKKILIDSLYRRKYQNGDRSLVEELHDLISKTENKRRIVICESTAASKYSGMGGMGKTLTAKWYANEYEKEYDHILWINCGEGSLQKSFESLAMDLEVKNQDKLNLKQMATKSFDELTEFKCLWIYDNAENYNGDGGIIEVLPKSEENFHCIITSRSREWGSKNVGFGKILDLELEVFREEESLDFLKIILDKSINFTDPLLKELCRLLGNLPLALQLAVATLNCGKIDLKSYIEKNKFEKVIDAKFDDYERTINGNVKISLEIILQEDDGKEAHDMMLIFGYIRPDDVEVEFFKTALGFESEKVKAAIKILKKYSLVAKRKVTIKGQITTVLSIHRLLQQVIRHNGRKTEEETLKKILDCEGFIDHKLLPFTKYANAKLQKEFPKVKAELLDQEKLIKLIGEERSEESVQLAKFISEELKTNTSKFNYAICLDNNEQLKQSVDVLEKLEKEKMKEEGKYGLNDLQMGMLKLKKEMSRYLIYGHLLVLYAKLGNNKRIQELLEKMKHFMIVHSRESVDTLVRIIHSNLIQSNYSLVKEYSIITLKLGKEATQIELTSCLLDLSSFDRLSSTELTLKEISFTRGGERLEEVTANQFIDLDKINRLILGGGNEMTKMCINLSGNISLEHLWLYKVQILGWKECKWNIQRLTVRKIPFVEKTKMTIKEIDIRKSSVDISCLPRTIQKLDLNAAEVFCSGEIDLPNLNYLTLAGMSDCSILSSFCSCIITRIRFFVIKEMNVNFFPKNVTGVKVTGRETIVVGGERRVNKLILEGFSFPKVEEFLSHFKTDDLVVHYYIGFTPKELIELTKKEIMRIAVGPVECNKDFSILSSHVDRKADFYLWEGGRGRGIQWKEFEEFMKLN